MKHVCPDCGYESSEAGTCPECEVPLLKRENGVDIDEEDDDVDEEGLEDTEHEV